MKELVERGEGGSEQYCRLFSASVPDPYYYSSGGSEQNCRLFSVSVPDPLIIVSFILKKQKLLFRCCGRCRTVCSKERWVRAGVQSFSGKPHFFLDKQQSDLSKKKSSLLLSEGSRVPTIPQPVRFPKNALLRVSIGEPPCLLYSWGGKRKPIATLGILKRSTSRITVGMSSLTPL